jgi:NAD-dependent dihydropyrimidine dehydrogenase PreA subunit
METSLVVKTGNDHFIELDTDVLATLQLATGDYFSLIDGQPDQQPRLIVKNTARSLAIAPEAPWELPPAAGDRVNLLIRLQKPFVIPERCIGCGICQHECPVRGKRAIRVTAENESRDPNHRLI